MKKLIYTFACLGLLLFYSCNSDDFSSSPSLRLEMETEAISFDTVFTKIGSATKQFKVYNRNNKSLSIQSVRLKHASKSGFRMNIDGRQGNNLNDIDILKKDSLFAFIEVTVDPLASNSPTIIRDTIEFTTNGNIQEVYLEAIGQNVHMWKGKIISEHTVLTNDKPYLISDELVVKAGSELKILEGVRFYFRHKASLQIHGTLRVEGTVEKPVIMRGDRFDKIDDNILFDNVSGQWGGIYFHPKSFYNRLENLHARNASVGMMFLESDPRDNKATLINTIVHNTSISGVTAINCNIEAQNVLFSNSLGATLEILGGKFSMTHGTVANYYKWSPRQSHALSISNRVDMTKSVPLECSITNSIVYGTGVTEVNLNFANNSIFNYHFKNCLLKQTETTNSSFENTIWNKKPMFKAINQDGDYVYDFSITEESPAINMAAFSSISTDIKGNPRQGKPDIGCYEFTK